MPSAIRPVVPHGALTNPSTPSKRCLDHLCQKKGKTWLALVGTVDRLISPEDGSIQSTEPDRLARSDLVTPGQILGQAVRSRLSGGKM